MKLIQYYILRIGNFSYGGEKKILQCAVTYMFYFQGKSKRGSEAGYPFKYGGVWKGKTQCLKNINGYGKVREAPF